jgi:hypothetical protein
VDVDVDAVYDVGGLQILIGLYLKTVAALVILFLNHLEIEADSLSSRYTTGGMLIYTMCQCFPCKRAIVFYLTGLVRLGSALNEKESDPEGPAL